MSVLYLVQNDTHLKNFHRKMTKSDIYIDIASLTGQRLDYSGVSGKELVLNCVESEFYRLNAFQRIRYLIRFWRANRRILASISVDSIVIGNDGAIQRLILDSIKNRGVPVDMWLDGLIELRTKYRLNYAKVALGRLFEHFGISYFVPSVIGTYGRLRALYVMDQCVKDEYLPLANFVSQEKVRVTQFPRHKLLIEIASRSHKLRAPGQKKRILYLTSAWLFHGYDSEHQAQLNHIRSLMDVFLESDEFEFSVRIHPRESHLNYDFLPAGCLSSVENYEEDLCGSDIILSARSTGLFEAAKIGLPVYIYNDGFGERFVNGFYKTLERIDSPSKVLSTLSKIKNV